MIHHVQLACPPGSEDALRAFYVGVLGLTEKPKPPALAARGGCWFAGHGIELHLGVEDDFRPARKAHPGLLWPDLDALAARARRRRLPGALGRPGGDPGAAPLPHRRPARQPAGVSCLMACGCV